MGICFVARSISASNLARVIADPPLVWRVLDPEDDTNYLEQLAASNRPSLVQRLFGKTGPAPVPKALDFSESELKVLDLDKAWDGLRTCIKLCVPDAPDFFQGQGQIGTFEVGYGPALYAESKTIADFASALDEVDEATLLGKLRTADFKGVYLADVWNRQDEDARSYLLENFLELRVFVQHCAAHEQGAVLQFT